MQIRECGKRTNTIWWMCESDHLPTVFSGLDYLTARCEQPTAIPFTQPHSFARIQPHGFGGTSLSILFTTLNSILNLLFCSSLMTLRLLQSSRGSGLLFFVIGTVYFYTTESKWGLTKCTRNSTNNGVKDEVSIIVARIEKLSLLSLVREGRFSQKMMLKFIIRRG